MPVTGKPRDPEEIGRIGANLIARCVAPVLPPADADKCTAVDVHSGEDEIDDDLTAVRRLHLRVLGGDVWLGGSDPSRVDRMGFR